MSTQQFVDSTKKILTITRAHGVPLIVNDRLDVMLAAGADGVHLGQEDMDATTARRLIGPSKILGVTVKHWILSYVATIWPLFHSTYQVGSVTEARKAALQGADYLGTSAVFPTPTKTTGPGSFAIGLAGLHEICCSVDIPVVAIGKSLYREQIDRPKLRRSCHLKGASMKQIAKKS